MLLKWNSYAIDSPLTVKIQIKQSFSQRAEIRILSTKGRNVTFANIKYDAHYNVSITILKNDPRLKYDFNFSLQSIVPNPLSELIWGTVEKNPNLIKINLNTQYFNNDNGLISKVLILLASSKNNQIIDSNMFNNTWQDYMTGSDVFVISKFENVNLTKLKTNLKNISIENNSSLCIMPGSSFKLYVVVFNSKGHSISNSSNNIVAEVPPIYNMSYSKSKEDFTIRWKVPTSCILFPNICSFKITIIQEINGMNYSFYSKNPFINIGPQKWGLIKVSVEIFSFKRNSNLTTLLIINNPPPIVPNAVNNNHVESDSKYLVIICLTIFFIITGLLVFSFRENITSVVASKIKKPSTPKIILSEQEFLTQTVNTIYQVLSKTPKIKKIYYSIMKKSPRYPIRIAYLPANSNKNRYSNIFPFDNSRVILYRPIEFIERGQTDYINANYIPGYVSSKQYIACQGPLDNTIEDFWLMVSQNNIKAIVMLTKLVENNHLKCSCYFPTKENPTLTLKLFKLTHLSETDYKNFTTLEMVVESENKTMNVKLYKYLGWGDFSVPANPDEIIKFASYVYRENFHRVDDRIIVHCSAGIGRTGTYIVIDTMLHYIVNNITFKIEDIILSLRHYRPGMVQTMPQLRYAFLSAFWLLTTPEGQEELKNIKIIYKKELSSDEIL